MKVLVLVSCLMAMLGSMSAEESSGQLNAVDTNELENREIVDFLQRRPLVLFLNAPFSAMDGVDLMEALNYDEASGGRQKRSPYRRGGYYGRRGGFGRRSYSRGGYRRGGYGGGGYYGRRSSYYG